MSTRSAIAGSPEVNCAIPSAAAAENDVDIGLVDFERTVYENAKRGVPFTVRPSASNPAPGTERKWLPANAARLDLNSDHENGFNLQGGGRSFSL
jgi:hypothetical protein